jgi:hypothetical protein
VPLRPAAAIVDRRHRSGGAVPGGDARQSRQHQRLGDRQRQPVQDHPARPGVRDVPRRQKKSPSRG